MQLRDTPLTISHKGHHFRFHPDGSLEDLGPDDCAAAGPPASGSATSPAATFARADDDIPEAFRELADTIAMLATACFDSAEAVNASVMTDPDETVDCGGQSDEEPDDDDAEAADSDTTVSSDGTLASAAAGTTEYSLRIMEATCINTNAMVALAGALLRAKSLSEMVVITTAHARRQIEMVADQTKQLAAAAHKMTPQNIE